MDQTSLVAGPKVISRTGGQCFGHDSYRDHEKILLIQGFQSNYQVAIFSVSHSCTPVTASSPIPVHEPPAQVGETRQNHYYYI